MARPVGRLAPDRMTDRALWDALEARLVWCRWGAGHTTQERECFLDQAEELLLELRLRRQQLQLLPPA